MTSLYFQDETGKVTRKWLIGQSIILSCVKCTFPKGKPLPHCRKCSPGGFLSFSIEMIIQGREGGWMPCLLELPPLVQPDLAGTPLASGAWECFSWGNNVTTRLLSFPPLGPCEISICGLFAWEKFCCLTPQRRSLDQRRVFPNLSPW